MSSVEQLKVLCERKTLRPTKQRFADAGFDLKSKQNYKIPPGEVVKVDTGVRMEIPTGYVGLLVLRSGADDCLQLSNSVGIIDSEYRGNIKAKIKNTGPVDYYVHEYDRLVQIVIVPVFLPEIVEVEELSASDRGGQGFGSSNLNDNSRTG